MAIVQISRITHRKGLLEDLPQLAGAELGYAVNERRLFIGNGTLQEGAPVIGNTEILTEFSNILALQTSYIYKGEAAGYIVQTGADAGAPVTQSLQSRLDSNAVVTDFGAVGDGVTDDTDAINRALFQLYCRSNSVSARRGLFFPAGTYLVKESIVVPPFAYLYGEGATSSVILLDLASDLSTLNAYAVRTGDSLQQTGAQIGSNGATPPQEITFSQIGFSSLQVTDIFLVDSAHDVAFTNCGFVGPINSTMIATGGEADISCVKFNSTGSLITNNISFSQCFFGTATYATYVDDVIQGIVFNDCHFDTLFEGIFLKELAGNIPQGVRIIGSTFDSIFKRGIVFDNSERCVSNSNTFYDVGTRFSGTPTDAIIYLNAVTNCSAYDMFDRTDIQVETTGIPRIQTLNSAVINIENGSSLNLGNYQIEAAVVTDLLDNTSATLFTIVVGNGPANDVQYKAFTMTYTFRRQSSAGGIWRTGVFTVISNPALTYVDDFTENLGSGLTFSASQPGASDTVTVTYTTTSNGFDGELTYSISHLA